ncbi:MULTISPECIES: carbon-nitrogen hydrolase family protein [Clostridia]|uniref:carbon-nitrogen hydrolase family protein n=1 Tax=Clostridia TaxID=186801 RepID=UPI00067F5B77|nr:MULTISPECIES: carbon-nitrogen hydrolase family protein [Clostridia]
MQDKKIKLAMVQMGAAEGNAEYNMNKIRSIIRAQKGKDTDIICFPELCVRGYDFEKTRTVPIDEKAFFADLAIENELAIVAGIADKREEQYFDTACFWDENGKMLHYFDKIHLWGEEREFFEPGSAIEVFTYKGWEIGLLVCGDLGFPELSRILAVKGAQLIIYPSAWPHPYQEFWSTMLASRAAENQLYVAGVNRAKYESERCGFSTIVDPSGRVMRCIGNDEDGIMEIELTRSTVQQRREEIPYLKYRMPGLYGDICKVF